MGDALIFELLSIKTILSTMIRQRKLSGGIGISPKLEEFREFPLYYNLLGWEQANGSLAGNETYTFSSDYLLSIV